MMSSNLIREAILFVLLYLVWRILQNLFLHPLRSVPGPMIAKVTSLYAVYLDLSGRRCEAVCELHARYGPVVRLAPDEISCSDLRDNKIIYSQGTLFTKGAIYETLGHPKFPGLFEVRDRQTHKERRKLLSASLSKNRIVLGAPLMAAKIGKSLQRLEQSIGTPVNVLDWSRKVALSIGGSVFLGDDGLGDLDTDELPTFIKNLDAFLGLSGLKWRAPWILAMFGWVPLARWRDFVTSSEQKYAFGDAVYRRYLERFGRSSRRDCPVQKLIEGDKTISRLTDEEISSEVTGLLTEGTEPVGITLTFALWELVRHPEWQEILYKEMKDANVGLIDGVPDHGQIDCLDSLETIIQESLRLHPSAPGALPRIAPEGGAVLGGFQIPAGTTVSSQMYTFHQNPEIFPSPDEFDPNRWLNPRGGTPAMREAYQPWSRGSRMCIGIHMATMELKLIIAALVYHYHIRPGPTMLGKGAASTTDWFAFMPKAGNVELVFDKR